jgi:hypothetical protein
LSSLNLEGLNDLPSSAVYKIVVVKKISDETLVVVVDGGISKVKKTKKMYQKTPFLFTSSKMNQNRLF